MLAIAGPTMLPAIVRPKDFERPVEGAHPIGLSTLSRSALNLVSHPLNVLFKLPLCCRKGVRDRNRKVFVFKLIAVMLRHDEILMGWDGQANIT